MNKIGEGKNPPHLLTKEEYRKDLEKNAHRFMEALDHYEMTSDPKQKTHYKAVMDESLALIGNAVREINAEDMRKHEVQVAKEYKTYLQTHSPNDLMALREDLTHLRAKNKK